MKRYSYIDHTADLGFEIYGKTLEDLLENAGWALFETQIGGTCRTSKTITLSFTSDSLEDLLVDWCRELLYNFALSGFIPQEYNIAVNNLHVNAVLGGDTFNGRRHTVKIEIKNATYHNLKVEKRKTGYYATIILDV